MDDVRTQLQRAGELVEVPDHAWDRLVERRNRSHRRQRMAALAVAVVVGVATIGGVAVLLAPLDENPTSAGSDWEPGGGIELRPGEYFYVRITSSDLGDRHIRDEETWWALDGSGEVRNRSTREDKYPYPPSGAYGPGEFPMLAVGVEGLSTDPDVLARELDEAPYEWSLLLLETPYASPTLRAAIFDVARGRPEVRLIEETRDPANRPAIALETSERDGDDTATWRVYFDPGTHQALAWTFESSRGGAAWQLIESGIVDGAGVRPVGDEWLAPPVTRS